jgi:hypothetical protein
MGISKLLFGNPGTKSHLDVASMERCKVYYKGKGSGFPQVRVVMSCLWLVLTPKLFQLCTNHFMLVLCRSVWISTACQFFLVPSWSSNIPLYPSKMLWAKELAPTPYSSIVFQFGFTFESLRELRVCHMNNICRNRYLWMSKILHWIKVQNGIWKMWHVCCHYNWINDHYVTHHYFRTKVDMFFHMDSIRKFKIGALLLWL